MLTDQLHKTKKEYQEVKETGDTKYIYQNELKKGCCQVYDLYGAYKDPPRITASGKVLPDRAFAIASNL